MKATRTILLGFTLQTSPKSSIFARTHFSKGDTEIYIVAGGERHGTDTQVCKVDKHGELLSHKADSPSKLKELLAKLIPSIVAMEGRGACHYWARLAQKHGHDVRV